MDEGGNGRGRGTAAARVSALLRTETGDSVTCSLPPSSDPASRETQERKLTLSVIVYAAHPPCSAFSSPTQPNSSSS